MKERSCFVMDARAPLLGWLFLTLDALLLPLLPMPLLLPLLLYSSFLSPPSLSASSSLSPSGPSPPPFPFSPPPPPLAIRRNQRLFHTHFRGTHTKNSANGLFMRRPVLVCLVSSSWWLSLALSPPPAHQCRVLTSTSFTCTRSMPFPHFQSTAHFSPTKLQERWHTDAQCLRIPAILNCRDSQNEWRRSGYVGWRRECPGFQTCGASDSKVSVCNAGDPGLIPGLGRSPGEGNGTPLQYSCLENPMDGGAW